MQEIKVSKGIKRITIPQSTSGMPMVIYKAKSKKKKKQSFGLRIFDRMVRRSMDAQSTFASQYGDRHRRSNRKKRNGWLRDLTGNVFRSGDKARKKMKLSRIMILPF